MAKLFEGLRRRPKPFCETIRKSQFYSADAPQIVLIHLRLHIVSSKELWNLHIEKISKRKQPANLTNIARKFAKKIRRCCHCRNYVNMPSKCVFKRLFSPFLLPFKAWPCHNLPVEFLQLLGKKSVDAPQKAKAIWQWRAIWAMLWKSQQPWHTNTLKQTLRR